MTRKELCNYLTGDTGTAEIIKLKQCLECDEVDQIDNWLAGVINSLYYRPNKLLLVICGIGGIGKTVFVQNILPNELNMFKSLNPKASSNNLELLYNNLILNCDTEGNKIVYKHITQIYMSDCKTVWTLPTAPIKGADKRLASMVTTETQWDFPQRKTVIVLNLKSIDLPLFFKIDKKKLWQQIYNRFKQ